MGSTAQKVVQLSAVPVLTIKEYLGIDKIKNIVFASSFNQEYSFSFPVLYQFMELFKAKLHLLKVITPRDFEPTYYSKRTIEDFASEFLLHDYQLQIVNAHTIEEGIEWFCNENKIDLVFMTTHGRKGLPHLLSGSHTEKIGQKYSFPVFSIKMIKIQTPKGVIFPD
jgi:nucleotide-binding universal stress UspA family protein